jgi:hypothetical protein
VLTFLYSWQRSGGAWNLVVHRGTDMGGSEIQVEGEVSG